MRVGFPAKNESPGIGGVMVVYREAIALIDKEQYAQASVKLERVVLQFDTAGDAVHTPKAMFWLGFCREKLGLDDSARQSYVEVIQRFPDSTSAEQARRRLEAMNE